MFTINPFKIKKNACLKKKSETMLTLKIVYTLGVNTIRLNRVILSKTI